ncbi:MAG: hypothetical protein ACRD6W_01070, partial [Nitrososphaerales archaeon]
PYPVDRESCERERDQRHVCIERAHGHAHEEQSAKARDRDAPNRKMWTAQVLTGAVRRCRRNVTHWIRIPTPISTKGTANRADVRSPV